MRKTIVVALASAALAPFAGAAQEPGSKTTRDFVQAAAASDRFEMLEATTALAQSADPGVRAYAEQMMRDHATLDRSLRDAARQAGLVPPPMAVSGDQSMFLAALQSARGRDFDQLYARQQVLAHRAALITQQQYAASGDAPAVRQAAVAAVPVVTAHLNAAEQLQGSLGGS